MPAQFEVYCPACHKGRLSLSNSTCGNCGFTARVEGGILDLQPQVRGEDYKASSAENLARVYEKHFWFGSRNRIILDVLKRARRLLDVRRLIDLGCGNGYVTAMLEEAGYATLGIDMHIDGLRIAEGIVGGSLICAMLEDVRLVEPVDAVCLLDVIEHLTDDRQALLQAASLVRPGGFVLVTVPALMQLWSRYDVTCGHKRRYGAKTLRDLFVECGFEPLYVSYFFMFSVLPVWLQRRLLHTGKKNAKIAGHGYTRPPHPLFNNIFRLLAAAERLLMSAGIKIPFGTSLIGLARVKYSTFIEEAN